MTVKNTHSFCKNQNSPSKNVFAEKTSHPWIIEFQFKKS